MANIFYATHKLCNRRQQTNNFRCLCLCLTQFNKIRIKNIQFVIFYFFLLRKEKKISTLRRVNEHHPHHVLPPVGVHTTPQSVLELMWIYWLSITEKRRRSLHTTHTQPLAEMLACALKGVFAYMCAWNVRMKGNVNKNVQRTFVLSMNDSPSPEAY